MQHKITITSYDDYRINFGEKYCDINKELKSIYQTDTFEFEIDFLNIESASRDRFLKGYNQIANRYTSASFSLVIPIIIQTTDDYSDFFKVFTEWTHDGEIQINKKYENASFNFILECNGEKINELLLHNFLLIEHKISSKKNNQFILNIKYSCSSSREEMENKARINTYIAEHKFNSFSSIYFNNTPLSWNVESIKQLFPAIFVDKATLSFLQNPISLKNWKVIIDEKKIDENTFTEGSEKKHWLILRACQNYLFDEYKNNESQAHTLLRKCAYTDLRFYDEHIKFMPFLAVLIFAQYDHYYRSNMLENYKNIYKKTAYSDFILELQSVQDYDNFKGYQDERHKSDIKTLLTYNNTTCLANEIKKSDFFTLLIDGINQCTEELEAIKKQLCPECHYRLIRKNVNEKNLINDIFGLHIIETTRPSEIQHFYESHLPNITAVGNIATEIKGIISKQETELIQPIREKIISYLPNKLDENIVKITSQHKIHPDIIAELFESITIAEGLLQLIENAVVHANGGLLSIHIYCYNNAGDNKHLKTTYQEYFNSNTVNTKFYLEVELSDLSDKNMKNKFIENIKNRIDDAPTATDLKVWMDNYNRILKGSKSFELFFAPSSIPSAENMWTEYYQIPTVQMHHYGLQIFESIIQSKKGVFIASGHSEYYTSENKYLPENFDIDQNIMGTSYRILLPLNHVNTKDKNIINSTSYERFMSYANMKEYQSEPSIKEINISASNKNFYKLIHMNYKNQKEKEERIEQISTEINSITHSYSTYNSKYLLSINCNNFGRKNSFKVELFIKGLLSFLFTQNNMIPVAITNLKSHDLLEVTRIIALFYNKQGESSKNMKNIQIYLKGIEVGEEILFAGNNLSWSASRMRKAAMTRGVMFDYWSIAQIIMERLFRNPNIVDNTLSKEKENNNEYRRT